MPDPSARKWYQDMTLGRATLLILAAPFAVMFCIVTAFIGLLLVVMAIGLTWSIPEIFTALAPIVGAVVMVAIIGWATWKGFERLADKYPWLSKLVEKTVTVICFTCIIGGTLFTVGFLIFQVIASIFTGPTPPSVPPSR